MKVFFPGKSADDLDADKSLKAMKKRSTLKLLIELYFVGVIEDASIFVNIIKDLSTLEHLKDRDLTQTNLSLLTSFTRQGRFFLGLSQSGQEVNDEVLITFIAVWAVAIAHMHTEHTLLLNCRFYVNIFGRVSTF